MNETPLIGDIDKIIDELETEFEELRSITVPVDDPPPTAKFCTGSCPC